MEINRLRKRRMAAGLTQEQAAELLGVSQSTVCQWETGRTNPRINMFPTIAQLYGCQVEDIWPVDNKANQE